MPQPTLPIDAILPAVLAAVRARGLAVVMAPPGAGKTTRIPPAVAGELRGQVVVIQPRRVAARAAARRMAAQGGFELGREVGYQVRFERAASEATRILVVTEGIALKLLASDPFLTGVGALIFDEFHERNLASDLALALAQKVRKEVRPDLALLVMSATLDAAPVASFLGGAPLLESAGRSFPVEIELAASPDDRPLAARVAGACRRLVREVSGDLLVFLPGVREIEDCREALAGLAAGEDLALVPLYGDLPPEEQDRALAPGARRRIVLATNVAETSITLEGVAAVVDSGLARRLEYDPGCGLDRLVLARISQASAAQRAGRAGRLGPGRCLRLWTAAEQASMPAHTAPEVRRVDLAGACLELLAWGETDLAAFPWFEAPEPSRLEAALALLSALGARDSHGVTARGRRMAELPLHPRLARLLLAGEEVGCLRAAALAGALFSERSPFLRERGWSAPTGSSDLAARVAALARFERGGGRGEGGEALHPGGARRVLQVRDQLLRRMGARAGRDLGREGGTLERALLAAYPDRLARRREASSPRGVMVGGRGVRLAAESGVRTAELFLCLDLDAGKRGDHAEALVRMASAVEPEWLADLGEGVVREETVLSFDRERERVLARAERRAFDLVLAERELPAPPEEAGAVLAAAAEAALERILPWGERDFAGFIARLRCLGAWMPELGLPRFEGPELAALLPSLSAGKRSFDELRRLPWLEILRGLLTPRQLAALEREAPERLPVPSGSHIRLIYEEGKSPVLAARIQELFGLAETPRVAAGRVPVLLHLLAPSGRPQQVTQDLASFWRNVYPEVRKELAGRYPKHAWPLDPWTARAERRPGRR